MLKKPIHIAFIFGLIVFFSNCQKKEKEETIDPATGCTNCTPSYATTFNGIFKTGKHTFTEPLGAETVTVKAMAYFSDQPVTTPVLANSTTVAAVYLNNDTLKYTGAPYYYTNTLPVNFSTETWRVTGAGAIPSFTFKNLKDKPRYSSISLLPDTVRKSVGFTIIVRDLQNITAASAYITDGSNPPLVFSKGLYLGNDTLRFTIENLSSLSTSTNASICIFMENSFAVKVETKDIKMSNEVSYTKRVVIKTKVF